MIAIFLLTALFASVGMWLLDTPPMPKRIFVIIGAGVGAATGLYLDARRRGSGRR